MDAVFPALDIAPWHCSHRKPSYARRRAAFLWLACNGTVSARRRVLSPRHKHCVRHRPSGCTSTAAAQALQKRLLQKSEEVADRDLRLKEAVETRAELEAAAARLPGPEAAQQLALYQAHPNGRPVLVGVGVQHEGGRGCYAFCVVTAVSDEATCQRRHVRAKFIVILVCAPVDYLSLTLRRQASLREKTQQLQALSAEVSMHQAQATEHKLRIRQLTDAINDTKQQWFAQKRHEQQRQCAEVMAAAGTSGEGAYDANDTDVPQTLGGGFVMMAAA